MEDKALMFGRIKWFDAERGHGVIGDVGGGSYRFELSEPGGAGFEPGQLVTFNTPARGRAEAVASVKMGSGPHSGIAA